ncbi:MAG: hypothetical protein AB7K68_09165 [Bacteriovoracia bacterium]
MSGKIVLQLIAVGLMLLGCAQPKYENSPSSGLSTDQQKQGQGLGIKFPQSGIQMAWRWEKEPVGPEEGVLVVRTYRLSPVDNFPEPVDVSADLTLKLWMPDMGHGSAPTVVERMRDANGVLVTGAYRVKSIYFIMPGYWEMIFEIQEGGVVRDSAKVSLVRAS